MGLRLRDLSMREGTFNQEYMYLGEISPDLYYTVNERNIGTRHDLSFPFLPHG